MADLITLQTRLAAAETAHHNLLTGALEEQIVTQNGMQVRYTRADADKLARYVASLKAEIAALAEPTRTRSKQTYLTYGGRGY